jgi:hypothetical protein
MDDQRAFGSGAISTVGFMDDRRIGRRSVKALAGVAVALACLLAGAVALVLRAPSTGASRASIAATADPGRAESPPVATPTAEPPAPASPVEGVSDTTPAAAPTATPTTGRSGLATAPALDKKGAPRKPHAKNGVLATGPGGVTAAATPGTEAAPTAPAASDTPEARRAKAVNEVFGPDAAEARRAKAVDEVFGH